MAARYLTKRATFTHGTTVSRASVPIQSPNMIDMLPGQPHVGAFQDGPERIGSRFTQFPGLQLELRGQAASGTVTPEGPVFQAMGFAKSGSTGFTFALGDPHSSTSVPAGSTTLLSSCAITVDTQQHGLTSVVADGSFNFAAGEIPLLTANLFGLASSAALATDSGLTTVVAPTVVVGPLPARWQAASVTINGVGSLVVKSINVALNNAVRIPKDANATFARSVPSIVSRGAGPLARILFEADAAILIENLVLANASVVLQWVYAAGGSTFKTMTYTMTAVPIGARWRDDEGVLGYEATFRQDPTTGPFTFAVT